MVFFLGIAVSAMGIMPKKAYKYFDNIMFLLLMLLLFGMGINIGANKEIISNLGQMGMEAFCIAIFSIFGSVIALWFLSKTLFRREI